MKSNKPILVVDDDPDIRDSIASALEIEGYAVLIAENGKAALDLLLSLTENERPRCIMLDLMMPVMTGEEFLRTVQADYADLKRIPVVVASANGSLLQSGLPASEVLKKPIDITELYRIAEQYN
ncbi:MAG: response regulator [Bacteriovoracaceae bacterium]